MWNGKVKWLNISVYHGFNSACIFWKAVLESERGPLWGWTSWSPQKLMEVGAKEIQDAGCKSEITSTYNLLNELSCHFNYVQLQKALLHKITCMCSNIPSPAGCRCIPGTVEWSLLGRLESWLWPEWTCSNLTGLHTRGKRVEVLLCCFIACHLWLNEETVHYCKFTVFYWLSNPPEPPVSSESQINILTSDVCEHHLCTGRCLIGNITLTNNYFPSGLTFIWSMTTLLSHQNGKK